LNDLFELGFYIGVAVYHRVGAGFCSHDPVGVIIIYAYSLFEGQYVSVTNSGERIAEEIWSGSSTVSTVPTVPFPPAVGHSLGLAISKSIMEQHQGRIWMKSVLQEHTTFYVHFPTI